METHGGKSISTAAGAMSQQIGSDLPCHVRSRNKRKLLPTGAAAADNRSGLIGVASIPPSFRRFSACLVKLHKKAGHVG